VRADVEPVEKQKRVFTDASISFSGPGYFDEIDPFVKG